MLSLCFLLSRIPFASTCKSTSSSFTNSVCKSLQDKTFTSIKQSHRFTNTMTSQSNGWIPTSTTAKNVLGGPLELCCTSPKTGYYRDGFCHTGPTDMGVHTVCAIVTDDFLNYSRDQGNDLITPRPQYQFPGLKNGDRWCLCVSRWKEAFEAGVAPSVVLAATHEHALQIVNIEQLRIHAAE